MMAVRSPLSVLPYCDTSSPFVRPESMSLEGPSISGDARNSTYSAPNPASTSTTDTALVTSNYPQSAGTEEAEGDKRDEAEGVGPATLVQGPGTGMSTPLGLTIQTSQMHHNGSVAKSDEDEPPQSVIHAPPGFGEFVRLPPLEHCLRPRARLMILQVRMQPTSEEPCEDEESSTSAGSEHIQSIEMEISETSKKIGASPISPPPLTTSVSPAKDWSDRATPRAQTRQEFEESERRTRSSSLEGTREIGALFIILHPSHPGPLPGSTVANRCTFFPDIPEGSEFKTYMEMFPGMGTNFPPGYFGSKEAELKALRAALTECWTLCNTLASLSYINRERLLRSHDDGMQEDAWRSCWRLCQKLYDTRDDDYASQVHPTLDLCRDFCQALFEVRVCDSDLTDSVLRVSFELNNHLYNTHDRNLPDAFRERTLDFYITLCHRLMKQRTRLTETDSLLSACWALVEMLFSIRQSKREGKELDEELLGSAVQACWELCDIFREGWTLNSMRTSDRGTPRPSQATFAPGFQQASLQSELEFVDDSLSQAPNPETPTTIFEDTATASPDEAPVPNILVLGHSTGHATPHSKWPSNASGISEKSRSSGQTASSANTVTTTSEDPNFTRLKVLITKAAINSGYQRGGTQNLAAFVKSLPSDAFGSAPWQSSLLKNYRKLVTFDPVFRNVGPQARVGAIEVARACQAMVQNGQYAWLRDLYRLVFGFHLEEAMGRKGVTIQT
ncbi:uncharacterized protein N7482_001382 [Penicillium canariense]|uniref:DUF7624 domain-containing protein n=1 Tax=Penicillium canariense TaxID=189055 RepID=A0A9W9LTH8_9EURO|nr:uncharacterized protein N7482_001382 [Penicillium canariense]KAJ5175505.1 hypothetical protein N7482_001382 [Penicillium canariense]